MLTMLFYTHLLLLLQPSVLWLSIVGFHMTSLKPKLKTIDPTVILLSRRIRVAQN